MAIIRRLVAQDDNEENQWLKIDYNKRYVVCDHDDWQFLFGPNSQLSVSNQKAKIGGEFNKETFDSLRLTGYLYNTTTGGVDSASSGTFNIYRVDSPNWLDTFVYSVPAVELTNGYYFANILLSDIPSVDLFGGDTLMIEVVLTRLNESYRERLYINHLGIFDNVTRVRADVEFLDITKKDL